jgi:hypothetical protein
MAYNITSQAPTLIDVVGQYARAVKGVVALSSGTITVTVRQFTKVEGVLCSARSSNNVYCSAHSGNTFTLTGTSADVIDYIAFGSAKL